jgi:outer membrane autotransporter protein
MEQHSDTCKWALLALLSSTISLLPVYLTEAADSTITMQSQVDALGLSTGDNVTHRIASGTTTNIRTDEKLSITGTGSNTLMLTNDAASSGTYIGGLANAGHALSFSKLNALTITSEAASNTAAYGLEADSSTITVDSTVGRLDIDMANAADGAAVNCLTYKDNPIGTITLASDSIHLSHGKAGIVSNGYAEDKVASQVNIGTADAAVSVLTIDGGTASNAQSAGTNIGILDKWYGETDIYAKKINITARTGISAYGNGTTTIHAGSGTGEGLSIYTVDEGGAPIGIWSQEHSTVHVLSGNVNITGGKWGLYAGNGTGGTIELGTPENKLKEVRIENTAWYAIQSYEGTNTIYADTIYLDNDILNYYGSVNNVIDIHGDTETTIIGDAYNQGGVMNINNLANDGLTKMTGDIYSGSTGHSTNQCTTDVGVQGTGAYLTGTITDVSDKAATTLRLANGGVWNVTGNSNLDTLKLDTGGVVNLTQNTEYQHVTAKNMTGNGGTLIFKTDLQASADAKDVMSNSDKLYITGDSSSGTHHISIKDTSKNGTSAVTDGYLLLISDQTGNAGASFTGSADIQNGGMFPSDKVVTVTSDAPEASLGYANVPATGTNWYLKLTDAPEPDTPDIPDSNAMTDNGLINVGFANSRYGALFNEQDNLLLRLGELRHNPDASGLWTRIKHGDQHSDAGVSSDSTYTMYQLGYDKKIKDTKQVRQFAGIAFNHTTSKNTYDTITAKGEGSADALTIYHTSLYDKGHYLDIVGKAGRIRGNYHLYDEDFPEYGDSSAMFYSLSTEYGRKKLTGTNGWYVEPQVQLTYSHLGSDTYTSTQGNTGYAEGIESLIFRTGTTVGRRLAQDKGNYYAKIFWNHDFCGDVRTHFIDKNRTSYDSSYDFGSSWWTIGIGANRKINDTTNGYIDLSRNFGGELKTHWQIDIGARWGF